MAIRKTIAQAILEGDSQAVDRAASVPLKVLAYNFVERPWGGMRIREYKGLAPLPDQPQLTGAGLGEAFEIAAYDADDEAREHPSRVRFDDDSELALPVLLGRHPKAFLGEPIAAAHGGAFPLLPKTLDVAELLSVQGHPEGHTEVYVIIDAEPGATLRVGFNRDMDPASLERMLALGRSRQQRLLELVGARASPAMLQASIAPWLADRSAAAGELPAELTGVLADSIEGVELLGQLKAVYWDVLDSMNAIEVEPGMIVHNANPARIVAGSGRRPSAEVHALGNPEGKEILALEIRRPGPTFRAWDNVRFPLRRIDVETAIRSLNLRRVAPEELVAAPRPLPGRPGVHRSVDDPSFAVEHLRPAAGTDALVPREPAHSLHCIAGRAELRGDDGRALGTLRRGESALMPAGVGAYRAAGVDGAHLVKAGLKGES